MNIFVSLGTSLPPTTGWKINIIYLRELLSRKRNSMPDALEKYKLENIMHFSEYKDFYENIVYSIILPHFIVNFIMHVL